MISGRLFWHTGCIVSGDWNETGALTRSIGYHAWAFQTGATTTSSWIPWEYTSDRTLHIWHTASLEESSSLVLKYLWLLLKDLVYTGSWDDNLLANRSVDNGPSRRLIFWNRVGDSIHSDLSDQVLYSSSAIVLGECSSSCTITTDPLLVVTVLVTLSPPSPPTPLPTPSVDIGWYSCEYT